MARIFRGRPFIASGDSINNVSAVGDVDMPLIGCGLFNLCLSNAINCLSGVHKIRFSFIPWENLTFSHSICFRRRKAKEICLRIDKHDFLKRVVHFVEWSKTGTIII